MGFKKVEKHCEVCGELYMAHRPTQQYCSYQCSGSTRRRSPECSVDGCTERAVGRGWCEKHYSAWKRTGDPFGWRSNPERRFWAKVEKSDGCWLWTGTPTGGGYGTLKVDGQPVQAHRFSFTIHGGVIPAGYEVDHLCRVRLCVNPEHLEAVTHAENVARGIPFRQ